ncbi:helix-turn-helix domain-containing protein [Streptomyces sp. NPDC045456]|uniref:helix-turn-helix domain-containing protein n=1 Tax=Streptomyces sp. NPDC045456 TaxID=3155254 RepID=UPI0033DE0A65
MLASRSSGWTGAPTSRSGPPAGDDLHGTAGPRRPALGPQPGDVAYPEGMRYPDGGGLTARQRARREEVRIEAAKLFASVVPVQHIARQLRVSRKSAYAWRARWCDGGVETLPSAGPPRLPSRMKPPWRTWLAAALEQGPARHGWAEPSGGRWLGWPP